MKIGVIQATSQKEKNELLFQTVHTATEERGFEVLNFGVFADETIEYSYVETALHISLLLASKAVDFIVTGCSSGQGMMLACNALPNVICGYTPTATDAYLFGRINDGNAVSIPLGLGFGWAGEIELKNIASNLFSEPFGVGYPVSDSQRKREDALLVKQFYEVSQKDILQIFPELDTSLLNKVLCRKNIIDYILSNSQHPELIQLICRLRDKSLK
ncbi:RpiB/LacA/LacB family sugar-phosphate isomerase [Isobaculum melis]|uniref:Ribose 5-phosphate isomerase RpiB n=1 Tax=Isobaculum melis TaxID=142588 RepID=A0A1H9PRR4_9LACT|nr:RpiB/LacA/LacB family sugar-phosphate isomerase [Isobaculum melis]SER50790.1 Ribose 5-phosphate isomerase RpiB [Isobaculum melis]